MEARDRKECLKGIIKRDVKFSLHVTSSRRVPKMIFGSTSHSLGDMGR